jgi:hypothetical protein
MCFTRQQLASAAADCAALRVQLDTTHGPGATGSERFGSRIDTTAATLEIAQCRADDFELQQQQQSCAAVSTTLPKNSGLADAKASAPAWTPVCSLHGKMTCSACSRIPPPAQEASIHEKAQKFWEQTSGVEAARHRSRDVPHTHKVFVGGLPDARPPVAELVRFFEANCGPVVDVLLPEDPSTGEWRKFSFVIFESQESADAACGGGQGVFHQFRPGHYIEVKRSTEKGGNVMVHGGMNAPHQNQRAPRDSAAGWGHTRKSNVCVDCGKSNPKYGMPTQKRKMWCGECAKDHPDASKSRTQKERAPISADMRTRT